MVLFSTLWMELLSTDTGIALWMELLSIEIRIAGIPRTQETKGRSWVQGRVEWNTEDLAAEAGQGDCALYQESPPQIAQAHPSGWNSSALK